MIKTNEEERGLLSRIEESIEEIYEQLPLLCIVDYDFAMELKTAIDANDYTPSSLLKIFEIIDRYPPQTIH
ncbi:MAG: hypothetical protein GY754_35455 [bacterium]|nr:hypothetical protein [bacterium]